MSKNDSNGQIQKYTNDETAITINNRQSTEVSDIGYRPATWLEKFMNRGVREFENRLENDRAEAVLVIHKAKLDEVVHGQLAMREVNKNRTTLAKKGAMAEDTRQIETIDFTSKVKHSVAVSQVMADETEAILLMDIPDEAKNHLIARLTKTLNETIEQQNRINYAKMG